MVWLIVSQFAIIVGFFIHILWLRNLNKRITELEGH